MSQEDQLLPEYLIDVKVVQNEERLRQVREAAANWGRTSASEDMERPEAKRFGHFGKLVVYVLLCLPLRLQVSASAASLNTT